MADESFGGGMRDHLMELLEYRVVLGALVTTMDGLVITHAGLSPEDAEMLAAASSSQPDDNQYSSDKTGGGTLHVLRGNDVRLILLTDTEAPRAAVTGLMSQHLGDLEESISA
jgi:predicted regulator of Ras-like GTPase activity (Roadblock/LC7/MglB family)